VYASSKSVDPSGDKAFREIRDIRKVGCLVSAEKPSRAFGGRAQVIGRGETGAEVSLTKSEKQNLGV